MAEAPIGMYRDRLISACLTDSQLVLDGGTGFLKVGYAAQVNRPSSTSSRRLCFDPLLTWPIHLSELSRVLLSLHRWATYSAIRGTEWGHRG